ncbi:interferon-induced, double-stranded RNA-activated protein kinase-like [Micropterus salmoides]|uniref:interferon-induced, double-stranded RNA-activated protein kinase-like n=1 Tax=Micropterus salmoides TaxID=27706 RepID=UPI0018ED38A1|nr:interferon-induced, double-stranded RNA-activated protein kinase-like [Micropterus salmoides]
METGNYVAQLHDYALKERLRVDYEDLGSVGPDHNKTFTQRAVLNGKFYPDGVGRNKKEAKRNAAKNALKCLLENKYQDSVDSTENATEASASNINYISWLHEYGQKNRVTIKAVESTRPGRFNATPCCSFVVGDKEYPAVTGKTKREAKANAAELVYNRICGNKTTETADEKYNCTSTQQQEERNPNLFDICDKIRRLSVKSHIYRDIGRQTETNYIGIVNHYCQKTKRCHSYIEERRCGSPDNPIFFYKLMIDKKEYPEGEGKTVKEARQNAARLAWSALQEQSDYDSKVSVRSTVSEDGAPPTLSARSASLESHDSSSQCTPMSTSASIIFTDSSTPSKVQMPFSSAGSEDDAPTRLSTPTSLESLASSQGMSTSTSGSGIFTDSSNSSKDQDAFKDKNRGNSPNESRFTSDFDPMDCLGKGAFGCVYKARHKLLDRFYAVKIVCREEKSLREVGTLSDLHHPNIVRYYTFWMEDSGYQWDFSASSSSSYRQVPMHLNLS